MRKGVVPDSDSDRSSAPSESESESELEIIESADSAQDATEVTRDGAEWKTEGIYHWEVAVRVNPLLSTEFIPKR